ncbi:uncharacterized protein C2orf74 homolog isoform X1 [Octodon degus]|uniref:Uncharacterized protein C2orf74 homolog isoform X1 n=2 Tax=Octodon degus TaxID=10160 RepID=A0A6P6EWJ1_OCTDE|nr:uncharacterized protein C2orf74 homolog isoform X1 [Octodon degus]
MVFGSRKKILTRRMAKTQAPTQNLSEGRPDKQLWGADSGSPAARQWSQQFHDSVMSLKREEWAPDAPISPPLDYCSFWETSQKRTHFKSSWKTPSGRPVSMDVSLEANLPAFESTTVTFFIVLLICFICIFLLLVFFLYKCFQDKKDEVDEKSPCLGADGGEDCSPLPADEDTNDAGDQEKNLVHVIDLNAPARPGILVQRRNKQVVSASGNTKDEEAEREDETKDRQKPAEAGDMNQESENLQEALLSSVSESQKRPLKGVTFSKEVIVVDLGNEHPAPQRYAQQHKERKRSHKRNKTKGNTNVE